MATGYVLPDSGDESEGDSVTYDWDESETLGIVKTFPISDYGTKSDKSSVNDFLVPEPRSLSEIIDSTNASIRSPSSISDVDEKYVEDDMSSLTNISSTQVGNAPKKHEFAKERMEREGNVCDRLYNACLKGKLGTIMDMLKKNSTHALMQDEDGQTPLYAACIGNHTEIVKLLIGFGYDVNHQDKEGKTPLHIAFENHEPDLAQMLITEFKANTELRDKENFTPLHTAIDRGYSRYSQELSEKFKHKDVSTEVSWVQLHSACFNENTQDLQFLLDKNADDVNHVSSTGYAPLHIAVTKSNTDLVTCLLNQKVIVNSVTIDGRTPLHTAADQGDDAIIQQLLAHNADPRLKDAPGNTCLHLAVKIKHETRSEPIKPGVSYMSPLPSPYHICSIQTVQAIIDHGADVNAVNNRGKTALWVACCDGQDSLVKILLDAKADPNITDKDGDSCLHAAIHGQCSTETIQKVFDHGAYINAVNNDRATPLLLACSTAQAESVELLLHFKADPNSADSDGDTSILNAVEGYCDVKTLHTLIDNGAKVNAANNKGLTALLKACSYSQMDVVKVLLEAGADATIVDDVHYSSLHAAVDGRCSLDTLRALLDHGAHIDATRKDGTNALLRACNTGQSESVVFLLEAGANVNIVKPNGNTILHVAVKNNCSNAALQAIILHGANINSVNNNSETALILACYVAQAESVKVLLEMGADPNISDSRDYTSLHAAIHGQCTDQTLQEIITHKVLLNAQDTSGKTALHLACSYRLQSLVQVLLTAGANPNKACSDGFTSLHSAIISGCRKNIIHSIIDHHAVVNAKTRNNLTALMITCQKGNKHALIVLLRAGADPEIRDADGNTWLHHAADGKCGKEMFQMIIDYGPNMNAKNNGSLTAVLIACLRGNTEAMNVLLKAGADPNIANADGDTCLHVAVRQDRSKAVLQAITDHGADVNATNKYKRTALMIACKMGNADAMDVLLNAGSDHKIADVNGATWIHHALTGNCKKEILQTIIKHGADVNATNKNNKTALMIAFRTRNVDAVKVLLDAGANPNIADANGNTCLLNAVSLGCSKEVLQETFDHGSDLKAMNKDKETPLLIANRGGSLDFINILLNAGADPNIVSTEGNAFLHIAVLDGFSSEILQAAIDHGADVNATNRNSETALMVASEKVHIEAFKILLNAGADPNIKDASGAACIHKAVDMCCFSEVLREMIDHGADVNAINTEYQTALMLACQKANESAVHALLKSGGDPNIPDANGETCLRIAIQNQSSGELVQALIEYGADVDAVNRHNRTALLLACYKGNVSAIDALLYAKADTDISDADGNTWLHYALYGSCSKEVVQTIIHHGADVNARNKNNTTPLTVACYTKDKEMVNVLLNGTVDVDTADPDGHTVLHHAVLGGCCIGNFQAIIDHGGDVNARNKKNVTALAIACAKRNVNAINVLLNAGADTNIADVDGNTCLHNAADAQCTKKVLQAIIEQGADVNVRNIHNETALVVACVKRNIDAISVLLHAGADVNIPATDSSASLLIPIMEVHYTKTFQTMIDHGADVNVVDKNSVSAIMLACQTGKKNAINVLLNAGADLSIVDIDGNTCLHHAVNRWCDNEVLEAIISHGADVNAVNKSNVTALMVACHRRYENHISVLLDAGADPGIVDVYGDSCLIHAAKGGCGIEVLESIIKHGAEGTNKSDKTALMIACQKGNIDTINILLNAGVNPHISDADGNTCLIYAVDADCNKEVLQAIIKHGADVNAANEIDITALMIACWKGNIDTINTLLNAGVNPHISDADGNTSLHYAVHGDCSKVVLQAMFKHGADVNATNKCNRTALMVACWKGNVDTLNILLNAGANTQISDADGNTCLIYAVDADCNKEVLQAIIKHGAEETNRSNRTALMIACQKGNIDTINILLNAGANPHISDANGNTCLHYAVDADCSKEVLEAVIKHGADVNATNKNSRTALMIACQKGNTDTINVLLNAGANPHISDSDGNTCLINAVHGDCSKEVFQVIIKHGADVNAKNKQNKNTINDSLSEGKYKYNICTSLCWSRSPRGGH